MATERVLSNLNLISFKTEGGLQNHIDELQEGDLAFTPDNSLKGNLFDFKWADHLLDDMSWLRADTFSWQSGDVYVAAYNHLVADFEGTTAETETIGNIEITYYRAEDKHKICLPDQEDKLLELYNATGIAWYYILDTANQQFKLPRSKHNKYADTVPVVGNGMALGLTNGTTNYGLSTWNTSSTIATTAITGAYGAELPNTGGGGSYPADSKNLGVTTDPEKSGLIAQQAQDTDQYKYLYFYIGNFERDAVEQTAGVTAETLNGKADSDLGNIPANYDYVVESQLPTEANGYTWYRKYKSGWVEQGGRNSGLNSVGVNTMPIEMADISYSVQITRLFPTTADDSVAISIQARNLTTTTFEGRQTYSDRGLGTGNSYAYCWQVSGMAAQ